VTTGRQWILGAVAFALLAWPTVADAQTPVPADNGGAVVEVSPQRAARQSWTSDRRSFAVGDVITVLIDEQTMATATTGDYAADRRRRDLGTSVSTSIAAFPRGGASIGSANDAESRQRGEATRQNRFVGEMTVRVVAAENGLLQVEGERTTSVDRNVQAMTLTGWIRPQDVSEFNLIESWRIGDASLTYTSSGNMGRPRGGIIGRLLGMIWP